MWSNETFFRQYVDTETEFIFGDPTERGFFLLFHATISYFISLHFIYLFSFISIFISLYCFHSLSVFSISPIVVYFSSLLLRIKPNFRKNFNWMLTYFFNQILILRFLLCFLFAYLYPSSLSGICTAKNVHNAVLCRTQFSSLQYSANNVYFYFKNSSYQCSIVRIIWHSLIRIPA